MAADAGTSTSSGPRDALVMEAILKEMGVKEYEPNVVHQMLEFSYRYITSVLEDAKVYSEHAHKKEVDVSDVKLAVQNRMDHSFTTPPPRDFLIEIARQKNAAPLPLIPEKFGPRLPPERYCLTANNFKVKNRQKQPALASPQVTLSATFRLPLSKPTVSSSSIKQHSQQQFASSPLLQATTATTLANMPSLVSLSTPPTPSSNISSLPPLLPPATTTNNTTGTVPLPTATANAVTPTQQLQLQQLQQNRQGISVAGDAGGVAGGVALGNSLVTLQDLVLQQQQQQQQQNQSSLSVTLPAGTVQGLISQAHQQQRNT